MSPQVVEANQVCAAAGNRAIHAPITFTLAAGERGLITGGNGSGKTCLLRALLGELPMASGAADICGEPVRYGGTWKVTRKNVRLVPQFPALPNSFTLEEYICAWRPSAFGCDSQSDAAMLTSAAATLLGQTEGVVLGTLSHGQKRLLEIFLACATRPAVIFADEPLAGLAQDRITWCVETLNSFSNNGGALLIVAHQSEQAHWKANWHREVSPA